MASNPDISADTSGEGRASLLHVEVQLSQAEARAKGGGVGGFVDLEIPEASDVHHKGTILDGVACWQIGGSQSAGFDLLPRCYLEWRKWNFGLHADGRSVER